MITGAMSTGIIFATSAKSFCRILQKEARKGEPRRLVVDLVAQEDKAKDEPVIVSACFESNVLMGCMITMSERLKK